jgi:hypothetical protein
MNRSELLKLAQLGAKARIAQRADESTDGLAHPRRNEVEVTGLGRRQLIVGFEVSIKCRFWVSAEDRERGRAMNHPGASGPSAPVTGPTSRSSSSPSASPPRQPNAWPQIVTLELE